MIGGWGRPLARITDGSGGTPKPPVENFHSSLMKIFSPLERDEERKQQLVLDFFEAREIPETKEIWINFLLNVHRTTDSKMWRENAYSFALARIVSLAEPYDPAMISHLYNFATAEDIKITPQTWTAFAKALVHFDPDVVFHYLWMVIPERIRAKHIPKREDAEGIKSDLL